MAKVKKADEELAQLKLALRYLAERWQEEQKELEPSLAAQTLFQLLAKIKSLEPGSPENWIKAAVHEAKGEALKSQEQADG